MAQTMKASPISPEIDFSAVSSNLHQESDTLEHELKILVDNHVTPEDVLQGVLFFSEHLQSHRQTHLITSQRDTDDSILERNGFNLRMRGNSSTPETKSRVEIDTNMDICIKTNPVLDIESGATKRLEFEADYPYGFDIDNLDASPLNAKYGFTGSDRVKLDEALGLIEDNAPMKEIFRLSADRTRYLIKFGYMNGAQVIGELNVDKVRTYDRGGRKQIAEKYTEIEFEVMHKMCPWFNHSAQDMVTKNATQHDLKRTFQTLKGYLETLPGAKLTDTSKSSRGYKALRAYRPF